MDRTLLTAIVAGLTSTLATALVLVLTLPRIFGPPRFEPFRVFGSLGGVPRYITGGPGGGGGSSQATYTDKRPIVTVDLSFDSNNKCVASEPLQIRASNGDALAWVIRNGCGSGTYSIRVANFRRKHNPNVPTDDDDGSYDPAVALVRPNSSASPNLETQINTANGTGAIPGRLTATGTVGQTYKYDILVSADGWKTWTTRDPDIEIWP
jgi:hypothetical protein